MKNKNFKSVSLPNVYYDMAKKLADKQGRSVSNLIQQLIKKEVDNG